MPQTGEKQPAIRKSFKSQKPSFHDSPRLQLILFFLSITVYLLTRLIGLPDFPIYFFTDEAIQTQLAADLVRGNFRNHNGVFLPTYFENGGQSNLSVSVYAQVLPYLLFGKSIWVTRGVSALISLLAALGLAGILRISFECRCWWAGPLLLAAVPAWFLHSRTAFETVMMASFYAVFLHFYLRYRKGQPKFLFPALIAGALAFYAYSPGQVIVVLTGVLLLVFDAKYHWRNRKTALVGLGVLSVLAAPYFRFSLTQKFARLHHLTILGSYWVKPIPLHEKLLAYIIRYLKGLNPVYWFWPNPSLIEKVWGGITLPSWLFSSQGDLARHTMKGYGHILLITFPFWLIGLLMAIKHIRKPEFRILLLATLAAPSGAAVVDWGITRGLVFIIPTTLFTALGIEEFIKWVQKHAIELKSAYLSIGIFLVFGAASSWMLVDALINGPTWYDDYGLGGMQYGAQQVFTRAAEIARLNPDTTVLVSSTWANAPDILMRFFGNDLPNLRMGNINAFSYTYKPLDRSMLFVMTGEDYELVQSSGKFTEITIEETIPYPNEKTGFYFIRLEYVEDIEELLAEERKARETLKQTQIEMNGQLVNVLYPTLDMNEIIHAFDGDPTTLIRTLEANPLRLVLTFPQPRKIEQVNLWIGGGPTQVAIQARADDQILAAQSRRMGSSPVNREAILKFEDPVYADVLTIEVLNTYDGEIAHVHLWEVKIE